MSTAHESSNEDSTAFSSIQSWLDVTVEESGPDSEPWDFELFGTQDKCIATETAVDADPEGTDNENYYASDCDGNDDEDDNSELKSPLEYEQDYGGDYLVIVAEGRNKEPWATASWDVSDCKLFGSSDFLNDPLPELPVEIRTYLPNSFRELHYFYNYVRVTLENSCRDAALTALGENLADQLWCRRRLIDPGRSNHSCRIHDSCFAMADKEWTEPGQIELESWSYFFGKIDVPGIEFDDRIEMFECLDSLRQAAVHREHCRLSKEDLEVAMRLPTILLDEARSSEIGQVYQILLQEPSARSLEDQAVFDRLVYTQENPPCQLTQLLGQLQYLCECSAFEYAKAKDPTFLEKLPAECPERIELQEYLFRWEYEPNMQHPDSIESYPDAEGRGWPWRQALYDIKQLRNEATHRSLRTDPKKTHISILKQRIEWAKAFVRMVGDPAQADRMQDIADEWLATHRPKGERTGGEKDEEMSAEEAEAVAAQRAKLDAEWEAAQKG